MSGGLVVVAIWLVLFLFSIRSYTAFIALVVALPLVLGAACRQRQAPARWLLIGYALAVIAVGVAVAGMCRSYYKPSPLASGQLAECTANGRAYTHSRDGVIENGSFVMDYICHEELCNQWPTRSSIPIDSTTPSGYSVYSTLLRYLNALGMPKDSAAVMALTPRQVASIERGIANPVYEHNGLRRMVYTLLYERECYVHYGLIKGSSLLQRVELWRATCRVIGQWPWVGVGLGDVPDQCHKQLQAQSSSLADTALHPHNQYLTFAAAFGLPAMVVVLLLFVRTVVLAVRRGQLTPLTLAFVCIVAISFVSEDTFETLAGILFCTIFISCRSAGTTGVNQAHSRP